VTLWDGALADLASVLSSAEFGETISYQPAAGGTFPMLAQVMRREPEQGSDITQAQFASAVVVVRNSATPTIGITNPLEGRDRITLAIRVGQAPRSCVVYRVLSGDASAWFLEVRA